MVAAGLAALLYLPARRWLTERANRLVYGERVAPDETLRTFGQRLTRSIPIDELLLQLAESLRKTMVLASAEVWTGQAGHYELAAGVPHRQPTADHDRRQGAAGRSPAPASAAARGSTSGCRSSSDPAARQRRVSRPIAHAGELLGLIVVTRPRDGEPFTETEDHVLTELARQVALALHNVQLDAALQASLDELRQRNEELQHSRARIVAAGDAERRKLERNLHDGAQQHLVALAVKLRLAQDAVEDDPADAMAMIDEIKGDVQDGDRRAALAGARDLPAAARVRRPGRGAAGGGRRGRRCATTVDTAGIGRYGTTSRPPCTSACSRRCRTPASTPVTAATVAVRVWEADGTLRFEVTDDGAGFDAASTVGRPATASSTWPTGSAPSVARVTVRRSRAQAPR